MIEKDERIISMLNTVIKNAQIIKDDFEANGRVLEDYVSEKLERAEWDLQCLLEITNNYRKGDK